MALFLSAAKNTQPKGNLPQYVPVRSSSFQLRALHNSNETIQTPMLRYLPTKTTSSEISLSDFGKFPRNTDRTSKTSKVDITDLSVQIPAKHRQDQRGLPRLQQARLRAGQPWQTTPPPFRMERRTSVHVNYIPYPSSEDKEHFSWKALS